MFALSYKLFTALNQNAVSYCHWKSNINLEKALNGYDDLDLLISHNDQSKFELLIRGLGFIKAYNPNIDYPFIFHYYGYDDETGNILHLHIYYEIITGTSWTKSLLLPIKDEFLKTATKGDLNVFLPPKYLEFVIFYIRIFSKCSNFTELLVIKNELNNISQEFNYLSQKTDNDLNRIIEKYFPKLTKELINSSLSKLESKNLIQLYFTGKKIASKIKIYKRLSRITELLVFIKQLFYRIINSLWLHEKKFLVPQGKLIAITGVDGTGKTTLTTSLYDWLNGYFTCHLIHMGKPKSSLLTILPNLFISLARRKNNLKGERYSLKKLGSYVSYFYCIRQVILAYDRITLIKKYKKKVDKGQIIICDRYPSLKIGAMDSQRLDPSKLSGFKKTLASLEKNIYSIFPEPDLVINLSIPVEKAVKRNRERVKIDKEGDDFIVERHRLNSNLIYKCKTFCKLSTDNDLISTIQALKKIVWTEFTK